MANTPFKMKGSPMQRNFGIGSPLKKTDVGPKAKPMVDKDGDGIPLGVDINDNDAKVGKKTLDKPKAKTKPKSKPKSKTKTKKTKVTEETKNGKTTKTKKKRGWFGFKDMGITEALDAMTKKQNE